MFFYIFGETIDLCEVFFPEPLISQDLTYNGMRICPCPDVSEKTQNLVRITQGYLLSLPLTPVKNNQGGQRANQALRQLSSAAFIFQYRRKYPHLELGD